MPSFCLASSLIMLGFQGGSQTRSTVASATPSKAIIFSRGVRGDHSAHTATGRGERHFNGYFVVVDFDVVNQTQVDNVNRNFRIIAFLQRFIDLFFSYHNQTVSS